MSNLIKENIQDTETGQSYKCENEITKERLLVLLNDLDCEIKELKKKNDELKSYHSKIRKDSNDNLERLGEIIRTHKNYSQYELYEKDIISENGIWDMMTVKGRESVLDELRKLERKSLNFFALATLLYNGGLGKEDFHKSLRMIYDD